MSDPFELIRLLSQTLPHVPEPIYTGQVLDPFVIAQEALYRAINSLAVNPNELRHQHNYLVESLNHARQIINHPRQSLHTYPTYRLGKPKPNPVLTPQENRLLSFGLHTKNISIFKSAPRLQTALYYRVNQLPGHRLWQASVLTWFMEWDPDIARYYLCITPRAFTSRLEEARIKILEALA